jgi:hypothetical protein
MCPEADHNEVTKRWRAVLRFERLCARLCVPDPLTGEVEHLSVDSQGGQSSGLQGPLAKETELVIERPCRPAID